MTFSPVQLKLLGWASCWPLVHLLLFLGFFVKTAAMIFDEKPPQNLFSDMAVLFPMHLFTMSVIFGLLVMFSFHVARNRMLTESSRLLWFLGFFAFSALTFPLYYWMYIRPRPPKALAE